MIFTRELHRRNASDSIIVTEFGTTIVSRVLHFLNDCSEILVTPDGISYVLSLSFRISRFDRIVEELFVPLMN